MAFVTFEGLEGSGKSTQAARLAVALGPEAVVTREPGGTELGRGIRGILLDPAHRGMAAATELLLYFADRAQHVAEVIRPALDAGRLVISDRYVDSAIAYQGYGRGLSLETLRAVTQAATGGLAPALTIFFDVSIESGLARVGKRGAHDRLESETRAFHERVRDGYATLMREQPRRWVRVDGEAPPDAVFESVLGILEERGFTTVRGGVR